MQAAEARLKEADEEVPPGPARRDALPLRGGGAALQQQRPRLSCSDDMPMHTVNVFL